MYVISYKSITADNGSEFLDVMCVENSALEAGKRTSLYYAHPYTSWERGSNENGNRMIRRFIPKKSDIGKFTHAEIQKITDWKNNYPRKILNFQTAEELFQREMIA